MDSCVELHTSHLEYLIPVLGHLHQSTGNPELEDYKARKISKTYRALVTGLLEKDEVCYLTLDKSCLLISSIIESKYT